jgi:hypothetical protein
MLMSFREDIGQIFPQFNTKEKNGSRFNILAHQMISDVDIYGSIIDYMIVSNIYGSLIVAKHGSMGNRQIKFSGGFC